MSPAADIHLEELRFRLRGGLLRALRGGSANSGIVTSFELRLHPIPRG